LVLMGETGMVDGFDQVAPNGVDKPVVLREFSDIAAAMQHEDTVALDLETGGLSPWKHGIHVIGLHGPRSNTVGVLHYPNGQVPQPVLDWLSDVPNLITHNGTQFDLLFLANQGMDWRKPALYDTLIGEQATLYTSRRDVRVNLKDTVKRHLGKTLDKEIDHTRWADPVLDEAQLAYIAGDITDLVKLRDSQLARAQEFPNLTPRLLDFEMALTKPIIEMELHGLPIDVPRVESYFQLGQKDNEERIRYLKSKLGIDINLRSPKQLKAALGELFDPKMFPGTSREVLTANLGRDPLRTEVCQALLDYRLYDQRRKMFNPVWMDTFVVDHGYSTRVHGKFWQLGTNTGRFSCSDPNLQQVPKDMRNCYGYVDGYVVGKSDYSAIEVRVAAIVAGDRDMIDAINGGLDIHRVVAAAGFRIPEERVTPEQRQMAKALSFTLVFGGGAPTFQRYVAQYGLHISLEEAELTINNFLDRFHGVRRMREKAAYNADRYRAVPLVYPTGLRRVLAGDELRPTTLLNNMVQGLAAAGIKYALMEIYKAGISHFMSAVVHDEFVYCARPSEIEEIRRIVDRCMIDGMRTALSGFSNQISIGVESAWGYSWKVEPETTVKTESGIAT
jgi:DNA polymerase I-like protein with 3'-5' exonuclease and polymerase domains